MTHSLPDAARVDSIYTASLWQAPGRRMDATSRWVRIGRALTYAARGQIGCMLDIRHAQPAA